MSMHSLAQSLQRLTISTVRLNIGSMKGITNVSIREFQHSAACFRKLDSHQGPRWTYPSSKKNRWEPWKKVTEMYEYTTNPVPLPRLKTGGRGPNGRIWFFRQGGGGKKLFRMIDWNRGGPEEGTPLVERVEVIYHDPNRTANIALVAAGERKRYVIATQNMKVGDLIKSSRVMSTDIVKANEGDSYPLGNLPVGTFVNCVQPLTDAPGKFACAAGVSAIIVRKLDDKVIVRLPSKREMCVSGKCTATVGRVSNIHNNKIVIGKAGRNRWRGIRPKSGRWHRKDGRFGRKIHGVRPMKVYEGPLPPEKEAKRYTLSRPFFRN